MEQRLYEDLTIEYIRQFGINMYYIPRVLNNFDTIYNEDTISTYESSYLMEFFLKNVDGFNGQGDFLSKFNIEIRDQVTFNVARKVFNQTVDGQVRPNEGDLLYFPLNKKIFVVRFVEHEEMFYSLGKLQTWAIVCELFEYSGEEIKTGIPEIDKLAINYSLSMANYELLTEDGFILTAEDGFPIDQDFLLKTQELLAQNDDFVDTRSGIIDFSESNPFAEVI